MLLPSLAFDKRFPADLPFSGFPDDEEDFGGEAVTVMMKKLK